MLAWGIGIVVVLTALYFLAKKFESLKNVPTEKLYETLEDENQYRFWFKSIEELVRRGEDMTYLKNKLLDGLESTILRDRVFASESYKAIFPNVLQSIGYKPNKEPDEDMRVKLAALRTK
ncbi:hypothetical protein WCX18_06940 [Sulfurimonas sp. HSL1-2]|uniref:hypothetical protein n=1 Tax=Sulfurimonadaceae TaxID=2771471 RepID=UPI0031F993F9